ncbi:HEXXH motif-containing putative peptide modification protein [Catellatospora citrea]|uniref:aKG-HExxH-type peptide beta-hydroxylase n=1 Tax=Catellatospora citrea TaxID=53366 RepID=UPI0034001140
MIETHKIDLATFDSIVAGQRHGLAVQTLYASRLSRTLLLLREIAGGRPEYADAVDTLNVAQQRDPHAVARILTYPWVAAWASRCARADTSRDTHHIHGVAAAAARLVGLPMSHPAPSINGWRHLPTLGRHPAELTYEQSVHRGGWQPVRRVRAGAGDFHIDIAFDDVDPFRACHNHQAAPRLDEITWQRWHTLVSQAWELLAARAPYHAAGNAAGFRALSPLNAPPGGEVSATSSDAFGGFGASFSRSPADFATTIVHELRHSDINALHDLKPLYVDDTGGYFAPWRHDTRPLGAMLQGIVAFTAVASVWHAFRADASLARHATEQFALRRLQVDRALTQVTDAPELTVAGRRLVAGLRSTIDQLLEHSVPDRDRRYAAGRLTEIEARWLQRADARRR